MADVLYVVNKEFLQRWCLYGKISGRARRVHSLIQSYGLFDDMKIVSAKQASFKEIASFHSSHYISFLQDLNDGTLDLSQHSETAEEYGLCYDCSPDEGVFDYAAYTVGATLTAASALSNGHCKVAINWDGGWHHAKPDEASGFCFFNDPVLAILRLKEQYKRILYVDLDLHHGDGVEDAFAATPSVFCFSVHKYSTGFFPGTGAANSVGIGKGKYHTVNVPLQDGVDDGMFTHIFNHLVAEILQAFKAEAVVCQCGADCLAGDPMKSFNLTEQAYVSCVKTLQGYNLPLLLLGGGGYNFAHTARCWTAVTAGLQDKVLSSNIPDHEYFPEYGPDYQLEVTPSNRANKNSVAQVESLLSQLSENIARCPKLVQNTC